MFPHLDDPNSRYACLLFAFLYSLTILSSQNKLGKVWILLTTLLFECVSICQLGWVTMNGSVLMGDSLWVLFDTNHEEALGFFQTVPALTYWIVISHLICTTTLLVTIGIYGSKKKAQTITGPISHGIQMAFILIFAVCCGTPFMRHKCPQVNFFTSYRLYAKDKKEVAEFYKNRQDLIVNSSCYRRNIDKTIVVIIGESANRNHYSLYGYPRNTSPRLNSIANELVIYSDVISPARSTLICMKQILSFANYLSPDMYKKEASIIEILRGAGYKTYWIDNQGLGDDNPPTAYRTIASTCDYYYTLPKITFDEEIFPFFDECLEAPAKNKVIFLHLIGSHFPYDKDAPERYWIFTDTMGLISPFKKMLTQTQIDCINMYDNTIFYNDSIVQICIKKLKNVNGACALLYLSDHGEELCETYQFCGRSKEKLSRSQCEIPFILWRNKEYARNIPLDIDTTRSFCTDDVIYSIMDMAAVSYSLKDTTRSIFSKLYKPKLRKVEGINYDDMPKWR